MVPLEGELLLKAWEAASPCDPVRRPLALLAIAMTGTSAAALEEISLVERNNLLLQLYMLSFGERLQGFAVCERCGTSMEFGAEVGNFLGTVDRNARDEAARPETFWNGRPIRPITSRMLLRALSPMNAADAERALLRECVDADESGAGDIEVELDRLRLQVAARNADAELSCSLSCVACEAVNHIDFDPAHFLWLAVKHRALALLAEVREIARSYGWSESSILAMSPVRRTTYLASASTVACI